MQYVQKLEEEHVSSTSVESSQCVNSLQVEVKRTLLIGSKNIRNEEGKTPGFFSPKVAVILQHPIEHTLSAKLVCE